MKLCPPATTHKRISLLVFVGKAGVQGYGDTATHHVFFGRQSVQEFSQLKVGLLAQLKHKLLGLRLVVAGPCLLSLGHLAQVPWICQPSPVSFQQVSCVEHVGHAEAVMAPFVLRRFGHSARFHLAKQPVPIYLVPEAVQKLTCDLNADREIAALLHLQLPENAFVGLPLGQYRAFVLPVTFCLCLFCCSYPPF